MFVTVSNVKYDFLLLKGLHGTAPDYLRHLINVFPPSKYDLRRNHDSGLSFINITRSMSQEDLGGQVI